MLLASFAWLSAALVEPSSIPPSTASRPDAVIVIGALHELHAREPMFDHSALREAITRFRPDILVLEVRPDELASRTATPGRPEYPAVVWPLLEHYPWRTVAMEPGSKMFDQLSSAAGEAYAEFRRVNPAGASLLSKLETAIDDALITHWTAPKDTQDETTGAVVRAFNGLRSDLVGPSFTAVQAKWDGYMARQAHEAVAANPGKRVLILASFRNRGLIEARVRGVASSRLVDARSWLESTESSGTPAPSDPRR